MEKIKVTQISKYYYPFTGGLEFVVKQIAETLSANNFDVDVIANSENSTSSSEEINNIRVKRCGRLLEYRSNPISIKFILELSKVNTDILHYHHPYIFAIIAHLIARPKFKHLIVTYHGDISKQNFIVKILNPIYETFLKKAERIHVLSPDMIANSSTLAKIKYPESLFTVVPFGINLDEFDEFNSQRVEEIKNAYHNKKILLFVGRLCPMKGLEYLILAMKQVQDDTTLLIIGEGDSLEELKALTKENSLAEKVVFLGKIVGQDLKSYYRACDIFVLPSVSEPFGIVQLEAMVCNKPVINTRLKTAINYASIHNETGLTVNSRSPYELAEAINLLLNDNNLRDKLSNNARNRVKEIFDLNKIKEKYVSFFQSIIENRKDINAKQ